MGRVKEFPYDTHIRLSRPNEYYLDNIIVEHGFYSKSDAIRSLLEKAEILYREGIDLFIPSTIEFLKEMTK